MYPVIKKSMGWCFHDEVFTPSIFSSAYKFPDLPRWRSRHFEKVLFFNVTYYHVYGREHGNLFSISNQSFCDEITGRRLPFCTSNSDNYHFFRWISWCDIRKPTHEIMPCKSNRRIKRNKFFQFFNHIKVFICLEFYEKVFIIQSEKKTFLYI